MVERSLAYCRCESIKNEPAILSEACYRQHFEKLTNARSQGGLSDGQTGKTWTANALTEVLQRAGWAKGCCLPTAGLVSKQMLSKDSESKPVNLVTDKDGQVVSTHALTPK